MSNFSATIWFQVFLSNKDYFQGYGLTYPYLIQIIYTQLCNNIFLYNNNDLYTAISFLVFLVFLSNTNNLDTIMLSSIRI